MEDASVGDAREKKGIPTYNRSSSDWITHGCIVHVLFNGIPLLKDAWIGLTLVDTPWSCGSSGAAPFCCPLLNGQSLNYDGCRFKARTNKNMNERRSKSLCFRGMVNEGC